MNRTNDRNHRPRLRAKSLRRRNLAFNRLEELEARTLLAKTTTLYLDWTPNKISEDAKTEASLASFASLWTAATSTYEDAAGKVLNRYRFLDAPDASGVFDQHLTSADYLVARREIEKAVAKNFRNAVDTTATGDKIKLSKFIKFVRIQDPVDVKDPNPGAFAKIDKQDLKFQYLINVSGSLEPVQSKITSSPTTSGIAYQGGVDFNNEGVAYIFGKAAIENIVSQDATRAAHPGWGLGNAFTFSDFTRTVANTITHEFMHLLGVGHPYGPYSGSPTAAPVDPKTGLTYGVSLFNDGKSSYYIMAHPLASTGITGRDAKAGSVANMMNYQSQWKPKLARIPNYTVPLANLFYYRLDANQKPILTSEGRPTLDPSKPRLGPQNPLVEVYDSLISLDRSFQDLMVFKTTDEEAPAFTPIAPTVTVPAATVGTLGNTTAASVASTFSTGLNSVLNDLLGTIVGRLNLPAGTLPLIGSDLANIVGLTSALKSVLSTPDLAGVTTMAELASRLSAAGFALDNVTTDAALGALPKDRAADLMRVRIAFPLASAFGSTALAKGALGPLQALGLSLSGSLDVAAEAYIGLVVGVDTGGFYLAPTEILSAKVQVGGELAMNAGSFASATARGDLLLMSGVDLTTTNADGRVRLSDLQGSAASRTLSTTLNGAAGITANIAVNAGLAKPITIDGAWTWGVDETGFALDSSSGLDQDELLRTLVELAGDGMNALADGANDLAGLARGLPLVGSSLASKLAPTITDALRFDDEEFISIEDYLESKGLEVQSVVSPADFLDGSFRTKDLIRLRYAKTITPDPVAVSASGHEELGAKGVTLKVDLSGSLMARPSLDLALIFGVQGTSGPFVQEGSSIRASLPVDGKLTGSASVGGLVGATVTASGRIDASAGLVLDDGDNIRDERLYLFGDVNSTFDAGDALNNGGLDLRGNLFLDDVTLSVANAAASLPVVGKFFPNFTWHATASLDLQTHKATYTVDQTRLPDFGNIQSKIMNELLTRLDAANPLPQSMRDFLTTKITFLGDKTFLELFGMESAAVLINPKAYLDKPEDEVEEPEDGINVNFDFTKVENVVALLSGKTADLVSLDFAASYRKSTTITLIPDTVIASFFGVINVTAAVNLVPSLELAIKTTVGFDTQGFYIRGSDDIFRITGGIGGQIVISGRLVVVPLARITVDLGVQATGTIGLVSPRPGDPKLRGSDIYSDGRLNTSIIKVGLGLDMVLGIKGVVGIIDLGLTAEAHKEYVKPLYRYEVGGGQPGSDDFGDLKDELQRKAEKLSLGALSILNTALGVLKDIYASREIVGQALQDAGEFAEKQFLAAAQSVSRIANQAGEEAAKAEASVREGLARFDKEVLGPLRDGLASVLNVFADIGDFAFGSWEKVDPETRRTFDASLASGILTVTWSADAAVGYGLSPDADISVFTSDGKLFVDAPDFVTNEKVATKYDKIRQKRSNKFANVTQRNTVTFDLSTVTQVIIIGGRGDDRLAATDDVALPLRIEGGEGNDQLVGANGADTILGGPGNDLVSGGAGDDSLDGGTDNDTVMAGSGNDTLVGGTGNDLLDAATGAGATDRDSLVGGDGDDTLSGSPGNDSLDGGYGRDNLQGNDGADLLTGGPDDVGVGNVASESDQLDGGAGNDTVRGGAGEDYMIGGAGNDLLRGGHDADRIFGDDVKSTLSGNDTIHGEGGNDVIDAGAGKDLVYGGAGADVLRGGVGDDTLVGATEGNENDPADGNDLITGGVGRDVIRGGPSGVGLAVIAGPKSRPFDILEGGDDADVIDGGPGPDEIAGGLGDDVLDGSAGNDTISGGGGADILRGGDDGDVLLGGPDQFGRGSTIEGGAGDDTIFGGPGPDTINAGPDAINPGSDNDLVSGGDGADLINGFTGNDTIEGGPGANTILGGSGDDSLLGGTGNDTLDGGTGRDTLDGLGGMDLLSGGDEADLLRGGDDPDTIDGGAADDTIDGGTGDDFLIGGAGNDAIDGGIGRDLAWGGDALWGRSAFLAGGFAADGVTPLIAAGFSVDGSTDGRDTLIGGTDGDWLFGGGEADSLVGGDGADYIDAGAGNDRAFGLIGADVLLGGIGADRLEGGDGDDAIYGNDGDDTLIGGAGSETLVGGWGKDFILAGFTIEGGGAATDRHLIDGDLADPNASTNDPVNQADTIYGDLGPDTIFAGAGNDIVNALAGDDIITGNAGNDLIEAGAQNDLLDGGDGSDILRGDLGDDVLIGGANDDLLDGGSGADVLWGASAILDRATLLGSGTIAIGATSILPRAIGLDPVTGEPISVGVASTADTDNLFGGPGTDWLFGGGDRDLLDGGPGSDYIDAGAGDDVLAGGSEDDVLVGGPDDDRLFGGAGINYLYGGAGRDVLIGFSATTDVTIESKNDGDRLYGGTGEDVLRGSIRRDTLDGGSGDDLIYGDAVAGPDGSPIGESVLGVVGAPDVLLGGPGADTLFGGGGDDTLWGGLGSDRLEGQGGADALRGGSGVDVLVLDVDLRYALANDSLDGHGGEAAAGDSPDDDATDILLVAGTSANDAIYFSQDAAGALRVDYNARQLIVAWRATTSVISRPMLEQIRVSAGMGDDRVEFLSGIEATARYGSGAAAVDLSLLIARGRDLITVIDGGPGNDILRGSAGRDELIGRSGSDDLLGMAGDDRLFGDSDASDGDQADLDRLFGGAGNDDSIGGKGRNQLYAWSRDPSLGGQFGIFVDPATGLLQDTDGGGKFALEDTGLNRMLGRSGDDSLYGGTGLDFLHGGDGGIDVLYDMKGKTFEQSDGVAAGDKWKDYARSTGKVWYVGGSNLDDEITIDYVTEPGPLQDRHVVTRLTENDGHFTFAAQVQLSFNATDAQGVPYWTNSDQFFDTNTRLYQPRDFAKLLPAEGDYLAIIIDALKGNDKVTVGPTVRKTVWIDAGDGNDTVLIRPGTSILVDQSEGATRNDTTATAQPLIPGVLLPGTDAIVTGLTLDNPGDIDWYRFQLPTGYTLKAGDTLQITDLLGSNVKDIELYADSATPGAALRVATAGQIDLNGLTAGGTYRLKVFSNKTPTVYQLDFEYPSFTSETMIYDRGARPTGDRRDIILGGPGDDVLSGGSGEEWIFGGAGHDVLTGGLDRGTVDLLFGGDNDDTFQVMPDSPSFAKAGSPEATDADRFFGGAGTDRAIVLGGDLDLLSIPVPDFITVGYNAALGLYSVGAKVWDTANRSYMSDASGAAIVRFSQFRPIDVESFVIDTRSGDDEVHAEPGFRLGGKDWGITANAVPEGAALAGLRIVAGAGDDTVFGGAADDVIEGGTGDDLLQGGGGDDTIEGGPGNDAIHGNVALVAPDAYESVRIGLVTASNDTPTFASYLPGGPSGNVLGANFHDGERVDWYAVMTPDAASAAGFARRSYLDASNVQVLGADGKVLAHSHVNVFPATRYSDGSFTRLTGSPNPADYYLIQVLNLDAWTVRIEPEVATAVGTLSFNLGVDGDASVPVSAAVNTTGKTGLAFFSTVQLAIASAISAKGFGNLVRVVVGADSKSIEIRRDGYGTSASFAISGANDIAQALGLRDGLSSLVPPAGRGYSLAFSATTSLQVGPSAAAADVDETSAAATPTFIPLGDINGDGFDDYIGGVTDDLGDPEDSNFGDVEPWNSVGDSYAYIHFGSANPADDLGTGRRVRLSVPAPILTRSAFNSRTIIAAPGDYNKDGIKDIALAITVQEADNTIGTAIPTHQYDGVYILLGRATWPASISFFSSTNITQLSGRISVASVGDFDGDGIDDLLVGDPFYGTNNAAAHIFRGRTDLAGKSLTPANAAARYIAGADVKNLSVGGIGDFNGDGRKDTAILVERTSGEDIVAIIHGRGTAPTAGASIPANLTIKGNAGFGYRRIDIRPFGDFDGDGKSEMLLAYDDGNDGEIVYGSTLTTTGTAAKNFGTDLPYTSVVTSGMIGLIGVGDLNGDGKTDLGTTAYIQVARAGDATSQASIDYREVGGVWYGTNTRPASLKPLPDLIIEAAKTNVVFEYPSYGKIDQRRGLFGAADVNGDGKPDLGLGDPSRDGLTRIYLGRIAVGGSSPTDPTTPAPVTPRPFVPSELARAEVATIATSLAGLNLAAVGAGTTVAQAFALTGAAGDALGAIQAVGDVSGDGVEDFLVRGATRAYLLYGPVDLRSRVPIADRADVVIDTASIGQPALGRGDINGDVGGGRKGVSDLVFTRHDATFKPIVTVIYGGQAFPRILDAASTSGLIRRVLTITDTLNSKLDQDTDVSLLDWNGDGYSDLFVHATVGNTLSDFNSYQNEARFAFIYSGKDVAGAATPTPILSLSQDREDRAGVLSNLFPSNSDVSFTKGGGTSPIYHVAPVGDLNGDGRDDLMVADSRFLNLTSSTLVVPDYARSYLLLGRTTTLTASLKDAASKVDSGFELANAIAPLGDVNDDGYADFAVVRRREDSARATDSIRIHFGAATPDLAPEIILRQIGTATPLSSAYSRNADYSVTAADYDGDGRIDLAVGLPYSEVRDNLYNPLTLYGVDGNVIDSSSAGRIVVFRSIADLKGATPVQLTSGFSFAIDAVGASDGLGTLPLSPNLDLDGDGRHDLAASASRSIGGGSGTSGTTYLAYGAPKISALPSSSENLNVEDALTKPYQGTVVLDSAAPDRWYRFDTRRDGAPGASIRLHSAPNLLTDGSFESGDLSSWRFDGNTATYGSAFLASDYNHTTGGSPVAAGNRAAWANVGGASGARLRLSQWVDSSWLGLVGTQSFDVGFWVNVAGASGISAKVTAAGQVVFEGPIPGGAVESLNGYVYVGGIWSPQGQERFLGELTFEITGGATTSQVYFDEAQAAPRSAAKENILADLLDAKGQVLASKFSLIDLRAFDAGTFYLHVYRKTGESSVRVASLNITPPSLDSLRRDSDRDEIHGGDGDDALIGNGGVDRLFGESGADRAVAEGGELRDAEAGDPRRDETIALSGVALEAADQVVAIPDVNLARKIAQALGQRITPKVPQTFLASRLATITILDATNAGIANMEGLQYLIGLDTLLLGGNTLTSLTRSAGLGGSYLAGMRNLEVLDISGTGMANLSGLAGVESILSLSIGRNPLPAAQFTFVGGLTNLRNLAIDSSNGATLQSANLAPLATLTSLVSLDVSFNDLDSLAPLAGLSKLRTLSAYANTLTAISPLTGLASLNAVSLTNNPLGNAAYESDIPALQNRGVSVSFTTNLAPTWTGPAGPRATKVGQPLTIGSLPASDPDGKFIYLTATSDTPSVVVSINTSADAITMTPAAGFVGTARITVTASDGKGLKWDDYGRSATQTFTLNVGSGAVGGRVFFDENAEGANGSGELGLGGFTVYADVNNDGVNNDGWPRTFVNIDAAKAIPDGGKLTSTIAVSGAAGTIADIDVTLSINHVNDADLDVFLISPTGVRVELFTDLGGSGDNVVKLSLDDAAVIAMSAAEAPFSGRFRPEGSLSALNGLSTNGTWTLEITDDATGSTGTLQSWSLRIVSGQGPTAVTDATGYYELDGLESQDYVIRVEGGTSNGYSTTFPNAKATVGPTYLVSDLRAGSTGSDPSAPVAFKGAIYYSADDGVSGRELYRTDAYGTVMVRDLLPGVTGSVPADLVVFNDVLYFSANDGASGRELWKYDGGNLIRVADINPGSASSSPAFMTVFNNALYFQASNGTIGSELWKLDAASVVSLVADINTALPISSSSPTGFAIYNGALYFAATSGTIGNELWKFDGTKATLAADIQPGSFTDSAPYDLTVFNGTLYFIAATTSGNYDLWKYDGSKATRAFDLATNVSNPPSDLVVYKNSLYLSAASTASSAHQLLKFDGTNLTVAVSNGTGSSSPDPTSVTAFAGDLYFAAQGSKGRELWAFDGTSVRLIADINPNVVLNVPQNSSPSSFSVIGNSLYLTATDGVTGTELRRLDSVVATPVIMAGLAVPGLDFGLDRPRVLIQESSLAAPEAGGPAIFHVKLSDAPTANVTVTAALATGADPDLKITAGATLTFTQANWNVAQEVRVTASADADGINGSAVLIVSATAHSSSQSTVTEGDDDRVIILESSTIDMPEAAIGDFSHVGVTRVKLSRQPAGVVTLSGSFGSGIQVYALPTSPTLTFTPSNWDVYQDVAFTPYPDFNTVIESGTYFYSAPGWANATITLRQVEAELSFPFGSSGTDNGTTINHAYTLNRAPSSSLTVTVEKVSGDADISIASGQTAVVTAANFSTPHSITFSLAAVDDDTIDEEAWYRVTAPGWAPKYFQVIIADSDRAILADRFSLGVAEGGAASVGVRLKGRPTGTVIVTASLGTGDADINIASGQALTFTTENWDVPQAVILTAANDADVTNGTRTLTLSSPGWISPPAIPASELDSAQTIVASVGAIVVGESKSATVQVHLSSAPASNVVVTLTRVLKDLDLSAPAGVSFTFTPQNWNVDQPLTINAANDADGLDGEETFTLLSPGWNVATIVATEADDDRRVIFSAPSLTVAEGKSAAVGVTLGVQPAETVVVTIARNLGDGDLAPTSTALTFTPQNWNVAQNMAIAAENDDDGIDGTASIVASIPGWIGATLTANESDDDRLFGLASPSLAVPESGTASLGVRLRSRPSANVVATVTRSSGDADLTISSGSSLTFTPDNWDQYQPVTLADANDVDGLDGSAAFIVSAAGWANATIAVTEVDDDRAFILTGAPATVSEGGTATIGVRLAVQPSADVVVSIARIDGDADLDPTSSAPLTFTTANWNVTQNVTIRAVADLDAVDDTSTLAFSAPGWNTASFSATEADDDRRIEFDAASLAIDEGGVATIGVRLGGRPSSPVTLTISRASGDADFSIVSGTSLVFSPDTWDAFQTVTVSAAIDADAINGTATLQATPDAKGWAVGTLSLIERDVNRRIVISTAALTVGEGSSATVGVRLGGKPEGNVVVAIARDSGDSDLTLSSGASLTFTPLNWNVDQPARIADAADADRLAGIASFTATASGWTTGVLSATEADDDTPGVIVTPLHTTTTVSEAGASDGYTVRLAARPTSAVMIGLVQPDLPATNLDFAAADFDVPRLFLSDAGSYTVALAAAPSSNVTLELLAADLAGATLIRVTFTPSDWHAPKTLNLSPAPRYTAVLTAAATVRVVLTPAGPLKPSASMLTFTSDNWAVAQTVTIAARNDLVVQGSRAAILGHVVRSSDVDYQGLSVDPLTVTIADDDVTGLVVTADTPLVTTETGGTARFRVALTSVPTAPVVISLRGTNATEARIEPAFLIFTPANALVPQLITVTGLDDPATDGTKSFQVVFDPATSADANYQGKTLAPLSLVNLDNDAPGIFVTTDKPLITSEAGGTAAFRVVLTSVPIAPVTISLHSTNTAEGHIDSVVLVFTPDNALEPQIVTVTGQDDAVIDSTQAYQVVFDSVTSTDANYQGSTIAALSFVNLDDDTVAPIRSVVLDGGADRTIAEGQAIGLPGATVTAAGPTNDLRVAIDWGDGLIEPVVLTFNAGVAKIANTHRYADDGTYSVGITLVGADVVRHDDVTVHVTNVAPFVGAIGARQVLEGTTIALSAIASDPGPLDQLTYRWQTAASNGSVIADVNGPSYPLTPADNGRYTIILTVSDDDGASTQISTFIDVVNAPPTVSIAPTSATMAGDAWSIGGSFSDTGADTYSGQVDYGEGGGFSSLALGTNRTFNLSHTYATAGTFAVRVRVTDDDGGIGEATVSLSVTAKPVIPPVQVIDVRAVAAKTNLGSLIVTMNGALDASSAANPGNYTLTSAGKDKKLGTKDDKPVGLKSVSYNADQKTVTIVPSGKLALATGARLTVKAGATDTLGRAIDGNRDGKPGGVYTVDVTKKGLRVLSAPARVSAHAVDALFVAADLADMQTAKTKGGRRKTTTLNSPR
ncbi:MAG: cya 2 [Planctomycetota bacterium]|nr:cya 2 [Planctomycetota bacterium]